ncbi:MAG: sulfatase-like hydrolase/transferase [Kofleriaceae bacterium]
MSSSDTRSSYAWIVTAHVLGATLLGTLESLRLDSAGIAVALIPVFALTGLLIGGVVALGERLVRTRRWYVAALGLALPTLLVTIPVFATLFDGAFAQTLPLAALMPVLAPIAIWLAVAGAIAIGRRLAAGDLMTRAIVIVALGGFVGGVVWAKRNLLGTGYPSAHILGTFAMIVAAGAAVRVIRRVRMPVWAIAAVVAVTSGIGVAAITSGLERPTDRRIITTYGDQGRDLVSVWRKLFDFDRDGSSALLGGGDCDDRDPAKKPGALDVAGDGIDQDCDGADAVKVEAPPPPRAEDLATWRARPEVTALLERTKGMNLILISVDALRADPLAPGAPGRAEFPRLCKLLDESVWFTRAFSPGAGTDISTYTLLTGRMDPYQSIDVTLPEALRTHGLFTARALPSEVLRHVGTTMLDRGFERTRTVVTDTEKKDIGNRITGELTTDEGLKAIAAAGNRQFFTWVHYFDVHEHHQLEVPAALLEGVSDGGSENAHHYRGLLLSVDRAVGRLLDELTAKGLADKTIVVFLSDHGESLKEDPRLLDTHGFVAYAPLTRIPMAIRIPGIQPGQRTEPVSLVDLAPTLMTLLGSRERMGTLDGIDLVPSLFDGPAPLRPAKDRALVIHEERQWSVVEWPYQLLVRPADDVTELYDLEKDPTLRDDLSTKQPDLTRRLRARYGEAPAVRIDRTPDGRAWRERQARPPQRRAQP